MANEIIKLQDWYAAHCEMDTFAVPDPFDDWHYLVFRNGRYVEKFRENERFAEWQHDYGVKEICTTADPCWRVIIDLGKTSLEKAKLSPIEITNGPDDWLKCEVKDQLFIGSGDPLKLVAILDQFFRLATPHADFSEQVTVQTTPSEITKPEEIPAEVWAARTVREQLGPDGLLHRLVLRNGSYQDDTEIVNQPRIFGSEARETSDAFDRFQQWYAAQCQKGKSEAPAISMTSLDNPGWSLNIELTGTELAGGKMEPIDFDNGDYDWLICNIYRKNDEVSFSGVGDPSKLVVMLDQFVALALKR